MERLTIKTVEEKDSFSTETGELYVYQITDAQERQFTTYKKISGWTLPADTEVEAIIEEKTRQDGSKYFKLSKITALQGDGSPAPRSEQSSGYNERGVAIGAAGHDAAMLVSAAMKTGDIKISDVPKAYEKMLVCCLAATEKIEGKPHVDDTVTVAAGVAAIPKTPEITQDELDAFGNKARPKDDRIPF